jgi:hypothetical protein
MNQVSNECLFLQILLNASPFTNEWGFMYKWMIQLANEGLFLDTKFYEPTDYIDIQDNEPADQ